MKLSKREKVLIFILIIALIIYAGYNLIPSLNLFNLETLRTEYNQKSIEYNTMSQNILMKSKYEEDIRNFSDEINNLNVISDLQQEKIIVFLNNYLKNNNIDVSTINFTETAAVPINTVSESANSKDISTLDSLMNDINDVIVDSKSKEAAPTEDKAAAEQQTLTVRRVSVNIVFESSYGNLLKFIDSIQNNKVDISITNINTVSEGNILQGTMTLNFYEVPKLNGFTEDNDEWMWSDLLKSGKLNPFTSDEVQSVFAPTGNEFDFYMSLQPESSDLPTLLIGKTNDADRKTYVSEDNNAVENAEFQFKTENNKYYYRYFTKNASYPINNTWQEFTPVYKDSIKIIVYSSSRNSKSDSSGANIAVNNTSGLKVRFDVVDDDKTNPRAYFKDPKLIAVTRK